MFIASGEIGGTFPGTALLISLLSHGKYLPENNSVLDCLKNVFGWNGQKMANIFVAI